MAPTSRWLHGRAADLLLGCGLWYALFFLALVFFGGEIRERGGRSALPFLVVLLSTPHYGATLLRVYERSADRRAYRFFALWATTALVVAFAIGAHVSVVGSLLVTLYFTWSPWHYTGQNYGLAVLFLRRRGVALAPAVKRVLYTSFILSYVITFLAIHSGAPADHYTPAPADSGGYRFLSLQLPSALTDPLLAVGAVAYVLALAASALLLLRRARAVDLLPVLALAVTQALWFSLPTVLRQLDVATGIEPWASDGPYYFLWIAVAHAVQYVWVTSYFAKVSGSWNGMLPYFARATGAGAIAWTLPVLLFAHDALGRLPYGAGLALLVAAVVNLHHFILDGAIWKLRDGRVARVLLRPRPAEEAGAAASGGRWAGRAVWALAAACTAIMFGAVWEREIGVRRAAARGDVERVARAVERLAWLGREAPSVRVNLARSYLERGDSGRASRQLDHVLALQPTAEAWYLLGALYKREQRWSQAANAFAEAVALGPEQAALHYELGLAWLQLAQPARALEAFEHAAALEPSRRIYETMRQKARRQLEQRSHF